MNMGKIGVLIVDDSALVRQMLTTILQTDEAIEVVGTAPDPYVAREKIKKLNPDVLTLDVNMPRMDGLTFLRNLMRLCPLPVVMVSSLTEKGAEVTLQALELGAVDFVTKPKVDIADGLQAYADEIITKVKMAARVQVRTLERYAVPAARVIEKIPPAVPLGRHNRLTHVKPTDRIIALGASTGGTEAIKEILSALPGDTPAIVITQHMPAAFTGPFARRMDEVSAMTVYEAQDEQPIVPGHVYIAPGDRHLLVVRRGTQYVCQLDDGPPVNWHRPSVDVMFRSVAQHVGARAVGVILTGMGSDGAHGLKAMRNAGAATLTQDEKTSIVWGMPGEAVKLGAADKILPLEKISGAIMELTWR
jgi:two-component system chemotaxis response regulator CheB